MLFDLESESKFKDGIERRMNEWIVNEGNVC
jgi:hypothetical protein